MIKVNQVSKHFEDYEALKEISCTIPPGCIYGMVGSHGAGKSTFLRSLNLLEVPTKSCSTASRCGRIRA